MTIPVLDAHHHLWVRSDAPREGILAAGYLDRDFGWEDFRATWPEGRKVTSLFVQVRSDLDEVGYVEGVARGDSRLRGMVAWAPLERPEAGDAIRVLRRHPFVRGVRRNTQNEPDPRFVARDGFVRGARLLGDAGLVCDVCVRLGQLSAAVDLARACPETSIVVEHLGKPDLGRPPAAQWLADVERLGRLPNVWCKLSPVVHTAGDGALTLQRVTPYVTHLLDSFPADRLLFGSNWPVSTAVVGYEAWVGMVETLLAGLDEDRIEAIFHGNAERLYTL